MRNKNTGFTARFYIIKQIINSLRKVQHRFAAVISANKLTFGNSELITVSWSSLKFSEILFCKSWLFKSRNTCYF